MIKNKNFTNYTKKFNLKNKFSIVLGGSGLLGSEVCKALNQFGSRVLNLDLIQNKNSNESKISFYKLDINNLESFEKKIEKIIKIYGVPEIFINCSYPKTKTWPKLSFKTADIKSLKKNIDLHLNSYIWIARVIAEKMKKFNVKGSIVQFSSMYGLFGQNMNIYEKTKIKENLAYSAIKGGIINNSKLMASYYGKYNIRVNTICPGGITGHVAGLANTQPKTFVRNFNKQVPLKRMGTSDEIASAVLFLASDASSYITGTSLIVDGGWTAI